LPADWRRPRGSSPLSRPAPSMLGAGAGVCVLEGGAAASRSSRGELQHELQQRVVELCPLPAARGEAARLEQLQPSRLRFDGRFDGRRFAFLAARTESD
jgi:hypothetical protein